jgi:heme/copper-type cytochrome/quinol oxidase subunit 4
MTKSFLNSLKDTFGRAAGVTLFWLSIMFIILWRKQENPWYVAATISVLTGFGIVLVVATISWILSRGT